MHIIFEQVHLLINLFKKTQLSQVLLGQNAFVTHWTEKVGQKCRFTEGTNTESTVQVKTQAIRSMRVRQNTINEQTRDKNKSKHIDAEQAENTVEQTNRLITRMSKQGMFTNSSVNC